MTQAALTPASPHRGWATIDYKPEFRKHAVDVICRALCYDWPPNNAFVVESIKDHAERVIAALEANGMAITREIEGC